LPGPALVTKKLIFACCAATVAAINAVAAADAKIARTCDLLKIFSVCLPPYQKT
jgi:hypothetical protein